jgi:hypothetical protein
MMIKTNLLRIPFNLMVAMIFMAIESDIPDNVRMYICFMLLCYLPENW